MSIASDPDGLGGADGLVLDCRGMRCPRPIIELARAITGVETGALLGVAATDGAARVDVPAWCRMTGQEYVGERAAPDDVPVYWVRRLT